MEDEIFHGAKIGIVFIGVKSDRMGKPVRTLGHFLNIGCHTLKPALINLCKCFFALV